ncbi:hypothetical protein ACGFNU_47285 [Spirillospora sp. NPDC048911]|uniref:hypothetical protein n=1 Tax=Spirillospora sp. NPDC048911 TaxID=3364527 RepID=UPI003710035A
MRTFKTIAVTGSLAALTLGVAAVPAQAVTVANASNQQIAPRTSADCIYYLNRAGFPTTVERVRGCNLGGAGFVGACRSWLTANAGVDAYNARNACALADS